MVSKLTTPDGRRACARIAGASSLVGLVWLALSVAGCPFRDREIRITDTGISWLVSSCRTGGPTPPPGGGGSGGFGGSGFPPPGPPGSGASSGTDPNACTLQNHYPPDLSRRSTEARLFLVTPGDGRVQDASKCMSLHPCLDGGPFGPPGNCMASDLNQQLDGAMPLGLGFDGLKNPEEAQLVLAFYQPSDSSEDGGGCHRADLFACAGLASPLGGGPYDISCASCQGGSRTSPGNDNGPCPKGPSGRNSCFLQLCDSLLANNAYE